MNTTVTYPNVTAQIDALDDQIDTLAARRAALIDQRRCLQEGVNPGGYAAVKRFVEASHRSEMDLSDTDAIIALLAAYEKGRT